ncbi:MAG TPA: hypothetical protein DD727_06060, partial [Clostridiales bacterium]|nr:hypothetical protein [Clostridiales bacterium]
NLFAAAGIASLYTTWLGRSSIEEDPLRGPISMILLFVIGILAAVVAELIGCGYRKLKKRQLSGLSGLDGSKCEEEA